MLKFKRQEKLIPDILHKMIDRKQLLTNNLTQTLRKKFDSILINLVQNIRVNGEEASVMDKANKFGQMVLFMMGSGKTAEQTVLVNLCILMEIYMKVIG